MKKFEALSNLPFGIKKGDIIIENGSVITNEKGYVVPLIPSKEKDFFREVIELKGKYEKDSTVYVKTVTERKVFLKDRTSFRTFKIPAYTPLTVVEHFSKSQKMYAVVKFNSVVYEILESELYEFKEYHFIDSKGIVHKAIKGQDNGADTYRLKAKNYFETKYDAKKALEKIMGLN
jgi:hypothetical protein